MKNYDFIKAKKYIQMHSDHIESAQLGMHEDWFWTAETIYEDLKFTVDLEDVGLEIAGISGSAWATPVLQLQMKDGSTVQKDCYVGNSDMEKPDWFELGVLSGPIQELRELKLPAPAPKEIGE